MIENLVDMHVAIIKALPHETKLIVSTCPTRLRDPGSFCADSHTRLRERMISYLTYPQIWQAVFAKSLSSLFPKVI